MQEYLCHLSAKLDRRVEVGFNWMKAQERFFYLRFTIESTIGLSQRYHKRMALL